MLFERFKSFFKLQGLNPDAKFLLTVSGGIDSVVMMHLFHRMKIDCQVAHCNFQLRGEESDGDEAFVRELAASLHYPVSVTRFETEEYSVEQHLSIQMAARELRYNWFDRLAKAHQIEFVAVAHNRDDSLETFFINLGRGTGISGLTGIRTVSGNIVRPLLFASRAEIERYATDNNIPFREDSSNASDKYLRNYIRHQLLPAFEQVFPHFRDSLTQNLEKLNDARLIYQSALETMIPAIVHSEKGNQYIKIARLLESPAPKTVLYEILKTYNFSSAMVDEIFQVVHASPGKQFFSATHQLVKDRDCYIISGIETPGQNRFYIDENTHTIDIPINLELKIFEKTPDFSIEKNAAIALLDCDKLDFPLILRKWQTGDYFVPLGMSGMKKISDFFVDNKVSIIDKEKTWLLTSGNHIVWVVGRRIDERFKVSEKTTKVLKVSVLG